MADPNPQPALGGAPQLPLSTVIGYRARVGDKVQFAYPGDDSKLVIAPARVVFVYPGDELVLDVKSKRGRNRRFEHVRPHLGGELLPNTWWQ